MAKQTPSDRRKALDALLITTWEQVLRLKKRLVFLDAFVKELHLQTRGETFIVRGDVIWQWFWDGYEMAVVQLASFAKGAYGEGAGFFGQLPNSVAFIRPGVHKALAPTPVMHESLSGPASPEDDARIERQIHEGAQKMLKAEVEKRLKRLFPGIAPGAPATVKQLDALKDKFADEVKALQEERHKIAHRFERAGARAPKASLEKLHATFKLIEQILGDIRLITFGSSFSFDAPHLSDPEHAARDLVDLMLIGDVSMLVAGVGMNRGEKERMRYYWQFREKAGQRVPAPWEGVGKRKAAAPTV